MSSVGPLFLAVWVSKLPLLCAERNVGDDALPTQGHTPQRSARWGELE